MTIGDLELVAGWLAAASRGVAFTGAGISTESGIPDFRSPGGIWTRYDPRQFTFQRYLSDRATRVASWQMRRSLVALDPKPNQGHRAIARLEELGMLRGVITQNIDRLHQAAGSRNVCELHGTMWTVRCLSCGATCGLREVLARVEAGEEDPPCSACGGILKTATVSFGQSLDPEVVAEASRWAREADVFLAVGSSLQVYPAAALPAEARRHGARLVILNREPTPLDDLADVVVRGEAGPWLAELAARASAARSNTAPSPSLEAPPTEAARRLPPTSSRPETPPG